MMTSWKRTIMRLSARSRPCGSTRHLIKVYESNESGVQRVGDDAPYLPLSLSRSKRFACVLVAAGDPSVRVSSCGCVCEGTREAEFDIDGSSQRFDTADAAVLFGN